MSFNLKKPKKKYLSFAPLLQGLGLRPTRQRLVLLGWLLSGPFKHATAEDVHAALKKQHRISLATVYNSLNKFTDAHLLRRVTMENGQVYFDTNTNDHHHLFDEKTGHLTDIPALRLSHLPKLPKGKTLLHIDVVLRVH